MALNFTTATDANCNVTQGRRVKYTSKPHLWRGNDAVGACNVYWTLTRSSTLHCEYLGFTKANAETVAAQLQAEYTRHYANFTADLDERDNDTPVVNVHQTYDLQCSSEITAQQVAGNNWKVVCSISETDVMISLSELQTAAEIEAFFQNAAAREKSNGSIAIKAAEWNGKDYIYISFSARNITDFNRNNVKVDLLDDSGEVTSSVALSGTADGEGYFASAENKHFRLNYEATSGGETSHTYSADWRTHDAAKPTFTITAADLKTSVTALTEGGYIVARLAVTFNSSDAFGEAISASAGAFELRINGTVSGEAWTKAKFATDGVRNPDGSYKLSTANWDIGTFYGSHNFTISMWYKPQNVFSNDFAISATDYIDVVSVDSTPFFDTTKTATVTAHIASDLSMADLRALSPYIILGGDSKSLTLSNVTVSPSAVTGADYDVSGTISYTYTTSLDSLNFSKCQFVMAAPKWTGTATFAMERVKARIAANWRTIATGSCTITPATTTPEIGKTFDWYYGDGTYAAGLSVSPTAHTITAPDFIVPLEVVGNITGVTGDATTAGSETGWLGGGADYIGGTLYLGCVTTLGEYAFYDFAYVTAVNAKAATAIEAYAFAGCDALKSCVCPNATTIGDNAFEGVCFDEPEGYLDLSGSTMATVQAMDYYPFGLSAGSKIKCSDGTITTEA